MTTENEYPPIADVAKELGVPLTQRRMPDLANHVPRRRISIEEARAMGWSMAWPGGGCRYAHDAAVYTSNPFRCSDCDRVKKGKEPIYPKLRTGGHYEEPRRKPNSSASIVIAAPTAPAPLEPDARDKKFLEAYAEHRSIERAATAVGTTPAYIESRRACNQTFATAITALEERLLIPRAVLPPPTEFEWTPEVQRHLIRLWIDTGELATARDSCGITPSQHFEHLEKSAEFAAAIEAAKPLAAAALEDRATQLALAGNDRLLQKLLEAKKPDEFGNKVRVDLYSDVSKLTDAQINQRLVSAINSILKTSGHRKIGDVLDAEIVEPAKLAAPAETAEVTVEETAPDSENEDLL
jgi:hypothetical protein